MAQEGAESMLRLYQNNYSDYINEGYLETAISLLVISLDNTHHRDAEAQRDF